jgi:hypothetical protein
MFLARVALRFTNDLAFLWATRYRLFIKKIIKRDKNVISAMVKLSENATRRSEMYTCEIFHI